LGLGLIAPGQTLDNARRHQLRQYKKNQGIQLEAQIQTSEDVHTHLLRDDHHFAGCYFFHSLFAGSTICRETLRMDDTACPNRYGFPILVILGIDEYKLSQLVAFALIRDRTMATFTSFLGGVKQSLRVGDEDSDSEPTPRAFVFDSHDGQLAALRQVFPESRIVFCAKHLGENIRRVMGHQSKAVGAFWDLIHGQNL
jgi:hypothetical protein